MKFDFTKYRFLYTADFETSTDAWGVDRARVWLWDICDEKYRHKTGTDLDSFMQIILNNPFKSVYGFRNLAYDGTYIITWLLENGYKHTQADEKYMKPKTFHCVISSLGQHYAYDIYNEKGVHIVITDTLKYVNMSIKKSAEQYNLPIKKGDIDYDIYRPLGWQPTEEEISYIHNDTEIDMRTVQLNIKEGAIKFTQAGNARNEFKKLFSKSEWEYLFPELDKFEDKFLRRAYIGGFVSYNSELKGKDIYNMISLDINSMYPAQMLHRLMPYGYPEPYSGRYTPNKKFPLYVQVIACCFSLKPKGIATIATRKTYIANSDSIYVSSSQGKQWELTLANPDLELFLANYDIWNVEWRGGYMFQAMQGREITPIEANNMTVDEVIEEDGKGSYFYGYIKKWRYIKEHEPSGTPARDYAKRMQNALYGALATNPERRSSIPYLDDNGVLKYKVVQSPNEGQACYLPAGIFITAWSRYFLITSIMKHIDRFVYCDTDSLYLQGNVPPNDLAVHKSLYGFFKVEHLITKFRVLGAKRYIYNGREPNQEKDKFYVTCCGADDTIKAQMNFDTFVQGAEFFGKKSVHNVVGGKHLFITTYRLGKKAE